MPSRNVIKQYVEGGYYHVYNRGVEKRNIFVDPMDYRIFTRRIARMLCKETQQDNINKVRIKNYYNQVDLVAFCLMPNHFHLLIKQESLSDMQGFMRTLCTSYSMYFNLKYKRVGRLFQGSYKAAYVETDEYLIHLSRYIHRNPVAIGQNIGEYPYSSYSLLDNPPPWIRHGIVQQQFISAQDYSDFVLDETQQSEVILGGLIIE